MPRKVKLLEDVKSHLSNEEKAQREDAKGELFNYEQLSTEAPEWLPQGAKTEWERLIPVMKKDFPLSETDYGLLVSYCLAYSRMKTAENEIRKTGTFITSESSGVKKANPAVNVQSKAMNDLKASANALGMTLEARSKLALNKAKTQEEKDPFKEMMES